jgi:hypothetical protein
MSHFRGLDLILTREIEFTNITKKKKHLVHINIAWALNQLFTSQHYTNLNIDTHAYIHDYICCSYITLVTTWLCSQIKHQFYLTFVVTLLWLVTWLDD